MTYDVVALLPQGPSKDDLMAALEAAGESWGVRAVSGGEVIQLCDDDGSPVLSIDTPLYIQVPGEARRLLGPQYAELPAPFWWLEVRATAGDDTTQTAWRYAEALVERVGGQIWAPPPRIPPRVPPTIAGGNR